MIEARQLTKRYGSQIAVNAISLSVGKGQIFGLLGPNAAGKTTTIRMLCGIIERDGGEITIGDQTVQQAKHNIGYVSQYFGQYEELSVWENLNFYAQIYGVQDKARLQQLLQRYDLEAFKHRLAGALSGGFQRRLALVCALAHDPAVLFLDEPTAGIDPSTRKLLWDDFYNLSAQGKTLFVTTHYMEEAQRCHQLAFLSAGEMVAQGSPASIKDALGEAQIFSANIAFQPKLRDALLANKRVQLVNQFGTELRILCDASIDLAELQSQVDTYANGAVLEPTEANLEDVFIALTQRQDGEQQ